MLGEARNYVIIMITLECIYLGKLPIGVEDLPDKKGRNVVPLSRQAVALWLQRAISGVGGD